MLTIITNKELETIIKLSGNAIRDFLTHAESGKFRGEAHLAIESFKANPADFTDDKLVAYGKGTVTAINYPVRIEVRGVTKGGAAQMVAKGIWGPKRKQIAAQIAQQCMELGFGLHIKLAGTSSMEFNVNGVDKSLPIHFLQGAFEDVLKEMNYKPGTHIDSYKTKTVIAADGDGTIYDGPRVGRLPSLVESPVKEPLLAYLRAGGIFMLISGNDIHRTFDRIIPALSPDLFCRVLIAANGGAELVHINAQGQAVPLSSYRQKALDFAHQSSIHERFDMFYVGDDGAKEGNDYPAFKAVGFKHSILVAKEFLAEYDPELKWGYVGGLLLGTKRFLEHFLSSRLNASSSFPDNYGISCCGDP